MDSALNPEFPPLKNDLIIRVAMNEKVEKVPVWVMRQAGRYLPEFREIRKSNDFFKLCRTPNLASLVTRQPIMRYPELDAAIIFSDILVVPQALGLEVQMLPGIGPHFPEPLRDLQDLVRLKSPEEAGKELDYVYAAITLCRKELEGAVPLFGFAGAPWTLMAYMIEGGGSKTLSKAKGWLMKWPAESRVLLQRITDVVIEFLLGQIKAGAQIVQVFDSWAGELSPADFAQFALPFLRQIGERVRPAGVPMVVFCKGAHYALPLLAQLDFHVISLDWTVDPVWARQQVGPNKVLQGNLDPSVLYGDEECIRKRVREMAAQFEGGWIANLGHGMYPDMDPQHLQWFLDEVHRC